MITLRKIWFNTINLAKQNLTSQTFDKRHSKLNTLDVSLVNTFLENLFLIPLFQICVKYLENVVYYHCTITKAVRLGMTKLENKYSRM